MSSLLQQLENNEAILLMYLADELPEEDRLEVEAMLQTDTNLAAELERLQAVHEYVRAEMAKLDHAERLPSEQVPLRRVRQEMARRIALREREMGAIEPQRRFPWWGYPLSAAAAVGLVLLIWWGALPEDGVYGPPDNSLAHLPGYDMIEEDPDVLTAAELLEEGVISEQLATLRQTEQELLMLQSMTLEPAEMGDESL